MYLLVNDKVGGGSSIPSHTISWSTTTGIPHITIGVSLALLPKMPPGIFVLTPSTVQIPTRLLHTGRDISQRITALHDTSVIHAVCPVVVIVRTCNPSIVCGHLTSVKITVGSRNWREEYVLAGMDPTEV